MKDIIPDLCDRMALLHIRHAVVFRKEPSQAHLPYIPLAEALEAGLRAEAEQAVQIARGVVDPADLSGTEFWVTPLGLLLFAAGGYGPGGAIAQSFAAAVLGCSRQWVNELIARGTLTRAASSLVLVSEVRELLKAKLDRIVK